LWALFRYDRQEFQMLDVQLCADDDIIADLWARDGSEFADRQ
jgi:hypothetical protein